MNIIKVPQLAWYEPKELELPLPDSWQVEVCNMAGYDRPALKPEEIKASIGSPIGMPPIRELARGKKEVVIIFDDMTRVTRIAGIVPFVLEELAEAGIPDNRIRFIATLGTHSAMDRIDFVKKLGAETVARFPVFNHNTFHSCTYVGTTLTYQTKVCINAEVMNCDLKIAIGSVVPHPMNGFGGGGKAILPGVAAFETIKYNHLRWLRDSREQPEDRPIIGMGLFDDNPLRADIEEAAGLAGLDVLINCIFNMWGETTAIFTGALKPAYAAVVAEARTHYLTPRVGDKDIVIANTFAKANEAAIGLGIAYSALKEGGDVVLTANAPDGQIPHYLLGPFGTMGENIMPHGLIPGRVNRLIIYSEYPDVKHKGWIEESDKILMFDRWDDVLRVLQESHGTDARVVVFPNSEIQYCA